LRLRTLCSNLGERAAIAIQRGSSACRLLPTLHADIGVTWVDFEGATRPTSHLGRERGCPGSDKHVEDDSSGLAAREKRSCDELNSFVVGWSGEARGRGILHGIEIAARETDAQRPANP
jgi:hypothetical protein